MLWKAIAQRQHDHAAKQVERGNFITHKSPPAVLPPLTLNSLRSRRFLSSSMRRSNEQAWSKKRPSKGARLGWAKNWGEVGRGEREGGGGWVNRNRSPDPLSLLLSFRTPSRGVSFPWRTFLKTPATQSSFNSNVLLSRQNIKSLQSSPVTHRANANPRFL